MKSNTIKMRIQEQAAKVLKDLDSAKEEELRAKAEKAITELSDNVQNMNLRAENEFDRLARKVVDSDYTLLATVCLVLAGVLIGAIVF